MLVFPLWQVRDLVGFRLQIATCLPGALVSRRSSSTKVISPGACPSRASLQRRRALPTNSVLTATVSLLLQIKSTHARVEGAPWSFTSWSCFPRLFCALSGTSWFPRDSSFWPMTMPGRQGSGRKVEKDSSRFGFRACWGPGSPHQRGSLSLLQCLLLQPAAAWCRRGADKEDEGAGRAPPELWALFPALQAGPGGGGPLWSPLHCSEACRRLGPGSACLPTAPAALSLTAAATSLSTRTAVSSSVPEVQSLQHQEMLR